MSAEPGQHPHTDVQGLGHEAAEGCQKAPVVEGREQGHPCRETAPLHSSWLWTRHPQAAAELSSANPRGYRAHPRPPTRTCGHCTHPQHPFSICLQFCTKMPTAHLAPCHPHSSTTPPACVRARRCLKHPTEATALRTGEEITGTEPSGQGRPCGSFLVSWPQRAWFVGGQPGRASTRFARLTWGWAPAPVPADAQRGGQPSLTHLPRPLADLSLGV